MLQTILDKAMGEVTQAVELKTLMWHESIEATERYYVELQVDEMAAELWGRFSSASSQISNGLGDGTVTEGGYNRG
jgi:hypothetical protein